MGEVDRKMFFIYESTIAMIPKIPPLCFSDASKDLLMYNLRSLKNLKADFKVH